MQVYFEALHDLEEDIERIANRFPYKRIEVGALDCKLEKEKLRLNLFKQTTLKEAISTDRLHSEQIFASFLQNIKRMPHSFYANRLKGAFKGVPAVVCGAGPSLEKSLPVLKELQEHALLIAGGSTLAALSSQGVLPHLGMAIDPNLEEYRRFKQNFAFEVPLLYSTRVHPGVFATCNGPFGYMRSGIGGVLELWLEEELGLDDSLIGKNLSLETISVTAICVAFAQEMGCNPILLNGIDMAYTGKKQYAKGVIVEKTLCFSEMDQEKIASNRIFEHKDREGNTVFTATRWLMESKSISEFAKAHPETKFINTTEGGIGFDGIAYLPIKEAMQGFQKQNLREKIFSLIDQSWMDEKTEKVLKEQIQELKKSFFRLKDHLEILSHEKEGSFALAEMEVEEEVAYLYLFYDIRQIFQNSATFWKDWLSLLRRYEPFLSKEL